MNVRIKSELLTWTFRVFIRVFFVIRWSFSGEVNVCVWLHLSASVIVYTKWFGVQFSFLFVRCNIYLLPAHCYMCTIQLLYFFVPSIFILSLSRVTFFCLCVNVLNVTNYNCTLLIIDRESKWSTFSMATLCIYFQFIRFQMTFVLSSLISQRSVRSIYRKRKTCHCRFCMWLWISCMETMSQTRAHTHNHTQCHLQKLHGLRYRRCMLRLQRTVKLLRLMWNSLTKWIFYITFILFSFISSQGRRPNEWMK